MNATNPTILLNYNFDPRDLPDWSRESVAKLFNERRRDSIFGFAIQQGEFVHIIRDHLGNVPIYWRISQPSQFKIATNLNEIASHTDTLDHFGTLAFLSFGSAKITPLLREIHLAPPGCAVSINVETGDVQTIYQYTFTTSSLPTEMSQKEMVIQGEKLLAQAIRRQIKSDHVGLFLSGGIDSGLIGIYLKEQGVKVTAYTAALWGKSSSELPFAKINAETIGVENHHIAVLESNEYSKLFRNSAAFYKGPYGASSGIGMQTLWSTPKLKNEPYLFFGQNSDTMTCSMGQQFHAYFFSQVPQAIRKLLKAIWPNLKLLNYLQQQTALDNYLSLMSNGLIASVSPFSLHEHWNGCSPLEDLTLAGMLIGFTPADGELIVQPAINYGQQISNPYYDVDLIEFCMGIPLRHRLGLSQESKIKIGLKKRLFQDIAIKHLPKDLVNRKKSFTVSMHRDDRTQAFARTLPKQFGSVLLNSEEQRFSAGILENWQRLYLQHLPQA